jgi:hypothetical protein
MEHLMPLWSYPGFSMVQIVLYRTLKLPGPSRTRTHRCQTWMSLTLALLNILPYRWFSNAHHLIWLHPKKKKTKLLQIITQLLLPIIDYAVVVYRTQLKPISNLWMWFIIVCRVVSRCPFRTHHGHIYQSLNLLSQNARHQLHWLVFFQMHFFNLPIISETTLDSISFIL